MSPYWTSYRPAPPPSSPTPPPSSSFCWHWHWPPPSAGELFSHSGNERMTEIAEILRTLHSKQTFVRNCKNIVWQNIIISITAMAVILETGSKNQYYKHHSLQALQQKSIIEKVKADKFMFCFKCRFWVESN